MIVLQAAGMPGWDRTLFLWINLDAQSSGAWVALALFATHWLPFVALAVLLPVALRTAPGRRSLLTLACALGLAWWAASLLKHGVTAPRPFMLGLGTDWLKHAHGNGFPSSHASVAAAFAVTALLSPWPRPLRWALVAAGALVGWSRIALGVHFPSDVAAALLLGSLCALLSQIATRQLANAWHHRSLARRVAPSGPVP